MKYLLTADIHLRTEAPVCRTDDDWWGFQQERYRLIYETGVKNKCAEIIMVGDINDVSDISKEILHLINTTAHEYQDRIKTVIMAGNHEVPQHATKFLSDSKIALLRYNPAITFLWPNEEFVTTHNELRLVHQCIFEKEEDVPDIKAYKHAATLLDEFPEQWIVCGDMHKRFLYESGDRKVINCGHVNRQKVSENYECGCWILDTEKNSIKYVDFPDDSAYVSEEHLRNKKEKDARLDELAAHLNETEVLDLDFIRGCEQLCTDEDGKEVFGIICECRSEE